MRFQFVWSNHSTNNQPSYGANLNIRGCLCTHQQAQCRVRLTMFPYYRYGPHGLIRDTSSVKIIDVFHLTLVPPSCWFKLPVTTAAAFMSMLILGALRFNDIWRPFLNGITWSKITKSLLFRDIWWTLLELSIIHMPVDGLATFGNMASEGTVMRKKVRDIFNVHIYIHIYIYLYIYVYIYIMHSKFNILGRQSKRWWKKFSFSYAQTVVTFTTIFHYSAVSPQTSYSSSVRSTYEASLGK